jgi:beta-glucosidase
MIAQQKFPKDFLWGASTASHQVEGGTVNQWSQWELAHAADLAAGAEKRLHKLPDWQAIREQAENPENYVSGKGVDHYNRYEEDFDLLEKLQFNSFRFGIEWSRIEPEEGAFNLEEIKHYHEYIDSLNRRGITPVLNIWHWTMPTWFTDKGGFEKKENLPLFEAYVQKVAEEYGDKVKYFITLNEPNVYASFGYVNAEWPPQQKNYKLFVTVFRNLAKAHNQAYTILKAANPAVQVGVAAQLANIQAKRPHNVVDGIVTKVMRYAWNWWFLNRIRRHQDFVGINYYFTDYYHGFNGRDTPHVPVNDLGWYMEPEGLYPLLLRTWARYKKPIIITENGVADRNDQYREWWLEQTVIAMQRALSEGVELKGYMHWSLLDNFEWAYGWWPKFGLIAVDRENDMKRTPRQSAIWFARYMMELQGKELPKKPQPKPAAGSAAQQATDSKQPKPPQPDDPSASEMTPAELAKRRAWAMKARFKQAVRPARARTGAGKPGPAGTASRRINLNRFRGKIQ